MPRGSCKKAFSKWTKERDASSWFAARTGLLDPAVKRLPSVLSAARAVGCWLLVNSSANGWANVRLCDGPPARSVSLTTTVWAWAAWRPCASAAALGVGQVGVDVDPGPAVGVEAAAARRSWSPRSSWDAISPPRPAASRAARLIGTKGSRNSWSPPGAVSCCSSGVCLSAALVALLLADRPPGPWVDGEGRRGPGDGRTSCPPAPTHRDVRPGRPTPRSGRPWPPPPPAPRR